jgi:hypothetical protein
MKLHATSSTPARTSRLTASAAFTLIELMVASGIALLVMGAAMAFMYFAGISVSGITSQSVINQQAGNTIEFIQSRARLATSIAVNASGTKLTLGFDDDPLTDSDGDGKTYNDRDHYEQFWFVGATGTGTTVSTNKLIYLANTNSTASQVLIPAGIRNLPGCNIFTLTNSTEVLVRFGVFDCYSRDHYQGIDIQATAYPLNRPTATNFISILP